MAERNQAVLDWVERSLDRDPKRKSRDLYEAAQERDPTIGALELRQFHGRYVLPILRSRAARRNADGEPKPRKSRGRKGTRGSTGAGKKQSSAGAETAAAEKDESTATPKRRGRPPKQQQGAENGGGRDKIRGILLELTRKVAGTETRADIVGVLGELEDYVDRVAQAAN
jgi:hypothetical protein